MKKKKLKKLYEAAEEEAEMIMEMLLEEQDSKEDIIKDLENLEKKYDEEQERCSGLSDENGALRSNITKLKNEIASIRSRSESDARTIKMLDDCVAAGCFPETISPQECLKAVAALHVVARVLNCGASPSLIVEAVNKLVTVDSECKL